MTEKEKGLESSSGRSITRIRSQELADASALIFLLSNLEDHYIHQIASAWKVIKAAKEFHEYASGRAPGGFALALFEAITAYEKEYEKFRVITWPLPTK